MREDTYPKEKISLLEKALSTLTERIEKMDSMLRELNDMKREIKGMKLFLGRVHPEFKGQFPELMKKIKD